MLAKTSDADSSPNSASTPLLLIESGDMVPAPWVNLLVVASGTGLRARRRAPASWGERVEGREERLEMGVVVVGDVSASRWERVRSER